MLPVGAGHAAEGMMQESKRRRCHPEQGSRVPGDEPEAPPALQVPESKAIEASEHA
jgi:hypothetical protein